MGEAGGRVARLDPVADLLRLCRRSSPSTANAASFSAMCGRSSAETPIRTTPAAILPMLEFMRALSIRQPYAELILRGVKTIEYRSRATRIIGEEFYIYASKGGPRPHGQAGVRRGQGSEVRGQESEVRGQKSAVRRRQPERVGRTDL